MLGDDVPWILVVIAIDDDAVEKSIDVWNWVETWLAVDVVASMTAGSLSFSKYGDITMNNKLITFTSCH